MTLLGFRDDSGLHNSQAHMALNENDSLYHKVKQPGEGWRRARSGEIGGLSLQATVVSVVISTRVLSFRLQTRTPTPTATSLWRTTRAAPMHPLIPRIVMMKRVLTHLRHAGKPWQQSFLFLTTRTKVHLLLGFSPVSGNITLPFNIIPIAFVFT